MYDITLFNFWQLFSQILQIGISLELLSPFSLICLDSFSGFRKNFFWVPLQVTGGHSDHTLWYNSLNGYAYGSWGTIHWMIIYHFAFNSIINMFRYNLTFKLKFMFIGHLSIWGFFFEIFWNLWIIEIWLWYQSFPVVQSYWTIVFSF